MADVPEDFITAVAAELATNGVSAPHKIGDLTFDENDACPAVYWRYGRVQHIPSEKSGGTAPVIYDEQQRLVIRVWGETRASTRLLKNQVLSILRKLGTGPAIDLDEDWDWIPQEHSHKGFALEGEIGLLVEVAEAFPSALRLIETETHDVTHENPATGTEESVC